MRDIATNGVCLACCEHSQGGVGVEGLVCIQAEPPCCCVTQWVSSVTLGAPAMSAFSPTPQSMLPGLDERPSVRVTHPASILNKDPCYQQKSMHPSVPGKAGERRVVANCISQND